MILRVWKAWATETGAEKYAEHYRNHVIDELSSVVGFRRAQLISRKYGEQVELTSLVEFESMEVVRGFAKDDIERAVVAEAARAVLERFDERVTHYEILHDGQAR